MEFIEDETPFDVPAVFIEFRGITWSDTMQNVQRAQFPLRLHIVTEWMGSECEGSLYKDKALERLNIVDGLVSHLFNWSHKENTTNIQRMQRSASYTNHNHGELVEDIEDFTCTVLQQI